MCQSQFFASWRRSGLNFRGWVALRCMIKAAYAGPLRGARVEMRIAIVTDAWSPQINGVVTTLMHVVQELEQLGHEVKVIGPDLSWPLPCPRNWQFRLALPPLRRLARILNHFEPEGIHITTEGTLGLTARRYCASRRLAFSTAYHTKFPEYIHALYRLPVWPSYTYLRWFHSRSSRVLVATPAILRELKVRGFRNLALWQRGVDTELFAPKSTYRVDLSRLPRPLMLYIGRVAVEKNVEAFLAMDAPGTKLVVGEGPVLQMLRERYPKAVFTGSVSHELLPDYYAQSDVFVFPSLTDTFGLVMLEAIACGTPVAAYPVAGPVDVLEQHVTGVMDFDLRKAVAGALKLDRATCRSEALKRPWRTCAEEFLSALPPCERLPGRRRLRLRLRRRRHRAA